ncbi:MAG: hypothetical protein APZ16_03105 [Candidatus Hadarchaeum yellowstonense]|jgi:uncharacterized membrane protein|uniref:EamA domain-containing protein n=1 Tax=Hadarchaeum yellowstonense TaxID=1776334 RepID=A0A147K0V5_HADYE|nr:MAG: hypothetical protein APZ16_03105 [Candidatus Hadarchaeum yellowstonense]
MGSLTFILVSVVSATVILNLVNVFTRSWRGQRFSRMSLGLTLASALFANLIGTFLYMLALRMENVSSLTPFISASVPIGFLLSMLIVRERPNLKPAFGMILIFCGVILAAI